MPGCGKTVLSTTVLDHLAGMEDSITLNFFFDFSDPAKQTTGGMLCSLILQLYRQGVGCTDLDKVFQSHGSGGQQPSTKALSDTISAMINSPKRIFILLDALDECDRRSELALWLRNITSIPDLPHVQLIATSRPEAEFQRDIPVLINEENCLALDKELINADIRSYISTRLEDSKELKKWASYPSVLNQIRDKIGRGAEGM